MNRAIAVAVFGLALRAAGFLISHVSLPAVVGLMVAGLFLDVFGQLLFGKTRLAFVAREAVLLTTLGYLVHRVGGDWRVFAGAALAQELVLTLLMHFFVKGTEAEAYWRSMVEEEQETPAVILPEEPMAEDVVDALDPEEPETEQAP